MFYPAHQKAEEHTELAMNARPPHRRKRKARRARDRRAAAHRVREQKRAKQRQRACRDEAGTHHTIMLPNSHTRVTAAARVCGERGGSAPTAKLSATMYHA